MFGLAGDFAGRRAEMEMMVIYGMRQLGISGHHHKEEQKNRKEGKNIL